MPVQGSHPIRTPDSSSEKSSHVYPNGCSGDSSCPCPAPSSEISLCPPHAPNPMVSLKNTACTPDASTFTGRTYLTRTHRSLKLPPTSKKTDPKATFAVISHTRNLPAADAASLRLSVKAFIGGYSCCCRRQWMAIGWRGALEGRRCLGSKALEGALGLGGAGHMQEASKAVPG